VSAENSQALPPSLATAVDYAPGVILSAIVAAAGYLAAPYVADVAPIPNMVIALVIGIALNPIAARPATQPGMRFCVSTVLRWAVALLGLRVGLADIAALGAGTAILIVIAIAATVVSGFVFAKWYGRRRHRGVRRLGDACLLDGGAGLSRQAAGRRLRCGCG
jgi:uncharacterized membrane protein YadS